MCAMFIFISIFGTDWLTEVSWKWSFGWKFSYLMTGNETVDVWICDYVLLGMVENGWIKVIRILTNHEMENVIKLLKYEMKLYDLLLTAFCIYYVSFHDLII